MKNVFHFSDSVELYQGDCFDILPGLGRFDFLWADPPYNVGKDYDQFDDAKADKAMRPSTTLNRIISA